MQTFQDTATSNVWAFNPDVVATNKAGVWSFAAANGTALVTPATLVPYTMPPAAGPTLAQQAATLLAANLANGIAITSTSTPALSATYALDAVSTAQVYQIGIYASQFGAFPSGSTQAYPDITGAQHTFSVAQFVAFFKAVAALVSNLNTQASAMAQGGSPAWPAQTATIA